MYLYFIAKMVAAISQLEIGYYIWNVVILALIFTCTI